MPIMRVCLGLSLLLVLLSCAKTTTIADYDDTVDFTVYTTFAWQVRPVPTTREWSAYEALAEQWVREAVEQRLAAKRPIDDDREAAFGRERQQAPLRLPVEDVVGELDEIDRLPGHHLLQGVVPAAV